MPNYLCYERDFANRWNVAVYHGAKPPKTVNGGEVERTTLHEIPADLMGSDGVSPNFGKLVKMFPAPKEIDG